MRFTFLGTGTSQGVPVIGCECDVCTSTDPRDNRLRSSLLIQSNTTTIVIDSGPDFRYQLLRAGVKKLDAVVFTHEHKDHVAGMDDVRPFNYQQKRPMEIFATERVQDALKYEYRYVFDESLKYPGIPKINVNTIGQYPFTIGDIELIPIQVYHHKLPVLGFRIGELTYITDASEIPMDERHKILGSKVVVLNALRKESHISHFTLDQATELMLEFAPEKGYFTHISHLLGSHEEISAELPEFIELAHDQLVIEL